MTTRSDNSIESIAHNIQHTQKSLLGNPKKMLDKF